MLNLVPYNRRDESGRSKRFHSVNILYSTIHLMNEHQLAL
jgi:hypothetical protein